MAEMTIAGDRAESYDLEAGDVVRLAGEDGLFAVDEVSDDVTRIHPMKSYGGPYVIPTAWLSSELCQKVPTEAPQ